MLAYMSTKTYTLEDYGPGAKCRMNKLNRMHAFAGTHCPISEVIQ